MLKNAEVVRSLSRATHMLNITWPLFLCSLEVHPLALLALCGLVYKNKQLYQPTMVVLDILNIDGYTVFLFNLQVQCFDSLEMPFMLGSTVFSNPQWPRSSKALAVLRSRLMNSANDLDGWPKW